MKLQFSTQILYFQVQFEVLYLRTYYTALRFT